MYNPSDTLQLWDIQTGLQVAKLRRAKHDACRADFSPDGQSLVTGTGNGSVLLWRLPANDELIERALTIKNNFGLDLSMSQRELHLLTGDLLQT
jgi:WD40 repeat protein